MASSFSVSGFAGLVIVGSGCHAAGSSVHAAARAPNCAVNCPLTSSQLQLSLSRVCCCCSLVSTTTSTLALFRIRDATVDDAQEVEDACCGGDTGMRLAAVGGVVGLLSNSVSDGELIESSRACAGRSRYRFNRAWAGVIVGYSTGDNGVTGRSVCSVGSTESVYACGNDAGNDAGNEVGNAACARSKVISVAVVRSSLPLLLPSLSFFSFRVMVAPPSASASASASTLTLTLTSSAAVPVCPFSWYLVMVVVDDVVNDDDVFAVAVDAEGCATALDSAMNVSNALFVANIVAVTITKKMTEQQASRKQAAAGVMSRCMACTVPCTVHLCVCTVCVVYAVRPARQTSLPHQHRNSLLLPPPTGQITHTQTLTDTHRHTQTLSPSRMGNPRNSVQLPSSTAPSSVPLWRLAIFVPPEDALKCTVVQACCCLDKVALVNTLEDLLP